MFDHRTILEGQVENSASWEAGLGLSSPQRPGQGQGGRGQPEGSVLVPQEDRVLLTPTLNPAVGLILIISEDLPRGPVLRPQGGGPGSCEHLERGSPPLLALLQQ